MKKFILTSLAILAIFGLAAVPAPAQTTDAGLFHAQELSLNLGTAYVVDTAAPFTADYDFNLLAGATYFPTKHFGLEANVPFYTSGGVAVSEVQAGLLARLPLSSTVPVLKNVAPYVGVGGVYNWQVDEKWAYIAKGGVEVRLTGGWSFCVEGQYRNQDFNWEQGSVQVAGVLKLVL